MRLTPKDIARRLSIGTRAVYMMLDQGMLPGIRIGRAGVEKFHDLKLRGSAGAVQLEVNAVGRVIRELDRQTLRGAEQWSETDLGEYERVAGVWVPMTEEQGPKDSDSSQKSKSVYDKADATHPFPASEFAFPATAAHAAAPEARP